MTVYVDNAKHRYGYMLMCHMMADDIDELHHMAKSIGLRRKWFQAHSKYPHYDICQAKRKLAVKHGAQQVTTKQLVKLFSSTKNLGAAE